MLDRMKAAHKARNNFKLDRIFSERNEVCAMLKFEKTMCLPLYENSLVLSASENARVQRGWVEDPWNRREVGSRQAGVVGGQTRGRDNGRNG